MLKYEVSKKKKVEQKCYFKFEILEINNKCTYGVCHFVFTQQDRAIRNKKNDEKLLRQREKKSFKNIYKKLIFVKDLCLSNFYTNSKKRKESNLQNASKKFKFKFQKIALHFLKVNLILSLKSTLFPIGSRLFPMSST